MKKHVLFKFYGFRFLENSFRLANHGSKIHKILKTTNKIRNVLNIRDVFKGKKTAAE